MKKLIVILILLSIVCFREEEMALIEHSKVQTWTKNVNWGIGPTDDTALRNVPVHVTTHNDGNSIYVAPNGDDGAGTGTAAAPFATIDKAFNTLGGKIIVTIERNGWTGVDMIFAAPDVLNPVPLTLQVEEGEVATIKRSSLSIPVSNSSSMSWYGVAYGNDIFVACAETDRPWYSTDGITWTQSTNPAANKNWRWVTFGNAKFVASVNFAKLWYSTDGDTWTESTSNNRTWTGIIWGRDKYLACAVNALDYSTDGITWTATDAPVLSWIALSYGNNIYLAADAGGYIYWSADGINWTQTNSPIQSWQGLTYGDDKFIATVNSGKIWYSYNGIDWFESNSLSKNWRKVVYGEGIYMVTELGEELYYSMNGIDWILSSSATKSWLGIGYGNGMFVAGTIGDKLYYSYNTVIKITSNSIVLNGFYLDGNNLISNTIYGEDTTASTFKFLENQNVIFNGINNFDSPAISECILKNLENDGVTSCKSPSIDHCVFNHIDGVGVSQEDDTVDMDHLTFNDCGTAIKINEAIVTTTKLVDLIINKCANAINSVITPLTVSTSVLNGVLTNVTPDGASLIGSKALFIDILNNDLNLRHIEEGYPINSPGVGLATVGTDSGAYDVDFAAGSTTWQSLDISNKCIGIEKRKIFVAPDQAHGLNGDLKRDYIDDLWEYSITARESADQQVLQHFHNIAKSNNITRFFPVGRDMQSFTSPMTGNDVVWNTKSSVDGIVIVTLTTANKAIFETFIGDNTAAGWYMAIKSISGTIAPHDNIYPYKIIEYNPNGTVYLENIHNRFPGTGMAANPDGTYSVMAGQSLFISTLQYTGTNTDNNYLLQMIDQNQAWIADQWVGYYVRFSSAFLPFVRYLRIVGNTGDVLTCDDPLGKSSFLVLNNYYWSTIDLIMTKARLNDVDSQAKGQPKEYGHHGNDWYSTKVTREENTLSNKHNYLAYNETGEQVVLVETSEFDADLL